MDNFLDRYQFLIFTMNGVLMEHSELYEMTFVSMMEAYGVKPETSRKYYRSTFGTPIEERIATLLPAKLAKSEPELVNELCQDYWESVTSVPAKLVIYGDELVRELRQQAKLLFVSEGEVDAEPEQSLLEFGIYHYFTKILGTDFSEEREAHIHAFAAMSNMSVARFCSNALFVGATVTDIEFATMMRIDSLGINTLIEASLLSRAGAMDTTSNIHDLFNL